MNEVFIEGDVEVSQLSQTNIMQGSLGSGQEAPARGGKGDGAVSPC